MEFLFAFLTTVAACACAAEVSVTSTSEVTTITTTNDMADPREMKADDAIVPSPNTPTDSITNIKETAPDFAHAVWDNNGKICLLARFTATFTITYPAQGGEQTVIVKVPENAKTKGRCASKSLSPLLELSWTGFRFNIFFNKVATEGKFDSWAITAMELLYNTEAPVFVGATNPGKTMARSPENMTYFKTPENKSFFCPSPDVIQMTNTKREKVVSNHLQDVHLQPFGIKKGRFSPAQRCSLIRIGGLADPYLIQDETVPIAVGSVLAVVAILVVVGYAVYKSVNIKRVDYNTME